MPWMKRIGGGRGEILIHKFTFTLSSRETRILHLPFSIQTKSGVGIGHIGIKEMSQDPMS
jgi:hypothetical protein